MTERRHGYGSVASNFREALAITDPVERRGWLLDRLWDTYEAASARHYLNKKGEPIPNPDGATITKVLGMVVAMAESDPELEQRAREAKARLVGALNDIPALAALASTLEQKQALLAVLKDAAVIAALKPNADINGAVGTFKVIAQVFGVGKDEDDIPEDELQAIAAKLLKGTQK